MKPKQLMGGQAVIEGVMMKSGRNLAIAVRTDKGKIVSKKERLRGYRFKWLRWLFIRGIVNLIEMLVIGMKSLIWSANQFVEEEEEFSAGELIFLIATSLGFAIFLFVFLPYLLTDLVGVREADSPLLFNLIDGVIKIIMFVFYILAISLMKDVKKLFQYHGAEHKAVWCYEAKNKLTVANCRKYSRLHPRCGTSFIMLVFIVSIFIFSVIPVAGFKIFPGLKLLGFWAQKSILFPVRLAFVPLIAAVGYEALMLTAKFNKNFLAKMLLVPGMALQRLTTSEPDDKQLEVAITSLNIVLKMGK